MFQETVLRSFKEGAGWGFSRPISREDLEKSEYLHDDGFDVTVTTARQAVSDHMVFLAAPNTKYSSDASTE